jgi:hypothetical protein
VRLRRPIASSTFTVRRSPFTVSRVANGNGLAQKRIENENDDGDDWEETEGGQTNPESERRRTVNAERRTSNDER